MIHDNTENALNLAHNVGQPSAHNDAHNCAHNLHRTPLFLARISDRWLAHIQESFLVGPGAYWHDPVQ